MKACAYLGTVRAFVERRVGIGHHSGGQGDEPSEVVSVPCVALPSMTTEMIGTDTRSNRKAERRKSKK